MHRGPSHQRLPEHLRRSGGGYLATPGPESRERGREGRGWGYAPVDPFKPSVALGISKLFGRANDRTIDDIPVESPSGRPRAHRPILPPPVPPYQHGVYDEQDRLYAPSRHTYRHRFMDTQPLHVVAPQEAWYRRPSRSRDRYRRSVPPTGSRQYGPPPQPSFSALPLGSRGRTPSPASWHPPRSRSSSPQRGRSRTPPEPTAQRRAWRSSTEPRRHASSRNTSRSPSPPIRQGFPPGTARQGSNGNAATRLTIMTADSEEICADGAGGSSGYRQQAADGVQKQRPTAEEEIEPYQPAMAMNADVRGPQVTPLSIQHNMSPPSVPALSRSGLAGGSSATLATAQSKLQQQRLAAGGEKADVFEKAQAAVLNMQGSMGAGHNQADGSTHTQTPSGHTIPGSSSDKPTAAELYQVAMAPPQTLPPHSPPPNQVVPIQSSPAPPTCNPPDNVPFYHTAAQEKAVLRRYEEARQAVNRKQSGIAASPGRRSSSRSGMGHDSPPIAYEALFLGRTSSHAAAPPPAYTPVIGPVAILSEKNRLRREYEACDQHLQQEAPPPAWTPTLPPAAAAVPPCAPQAPLQRDLRHDPLEVQEVMRTSPSKMGEAVGVGNYMQSPTVVAAVVDIGEQEGVEEWAVKSQHTSASSFLHPALPSRIQQPTMNRFAKQNQRYLGREDTEEDGEHRNDRSPARERKRYPILHHGRPTSPPEDSPLPTMPQCGSDPTAQVPSYADPLITSVPSQRPRPVGRRNRSRNRGGSSRTRSRSNVALYSNSSQSAAMDSHTTPTVHNAQLQRPTTESDDITVTHQPSLIVLRDTRDGSDDKGSVGYHHGDNIDNGTPATIIPEHGVEAKQSPILCRERKDDYATDPSLVSPVGFHLQPQGSREEHDRSGIEVTCITIFLSLFLDVVPRQVYLHLLLRFPALYFSRVTRIFQDANLGMGEIKRMALEAVELDKEEGLNRMLVYQGMFPQEWLGGGATTSASYVNLRNSWQAFIDALMREWKTLNLISVLLLSAILTILQIESAASNPLTRFSALLSLVCALMSLIYGCLYIVRFGTMRRTHKAAEWANESERTSTAIFWNVWVMLAMPAVWLAWSMIFYIVCIMSFVWQTGTISEPRDYLPSDLPILIPRIIISCVLGLGFVYLILMGATFRRYSDPMEQAWQERIQGWLAEKSHPSNVYCTADGRVNHYDKPKGSGHDHFTLNQPSRKATKVEVPSWQSVDKVNKSRSAFVDQGEGVKSSAKAAAFTSPLSHSGYPRTTVNMDSVGSLAKAGNGDTGTYNIPPINPFISFAHAPPPPHAARGMDVTPGSPPTSRPAQPLSKAGRVAGADSIDGIADLDRRSQNAPPRVQDGVEAPVEAEALEDELPQPSAVNEDSESPSNGIVKTVIAVPIKDAPDKDGDLHNVEEMKAIIHFNYDMGAHLAGEDGYRDGNPGSDIVTSTAPESVAVPRCLLEAGLASLSWEMFCADIRSTWATVTDGKPSALAEMVEVVDTWNSSFETFDVFTALVQFSDTGSDVDGPTPEKLTQPAYTLYLGPRNVKAVGVRSAADDNVRVCRLVLLDGEDSALGPDIPEILHIVGKSDGVLRSRFSDDEKDMTRRITEVANTRLHEWT